MNLLSFILLFILITGSSTTCNITINTEKGQCKVKKYNSLTLNVNNILADDEEFSLITSSSDENESINIDSNKNSSSDLELFCYEIHYLNSLNPLRLDIPPPFCSYFSE